LSGGSHDEPVSASARVRQHEPSPAIARVALLVASRIEIGACSTHDLSQLYGFAMCTFGALPGWSRRRVVELLLDDVVFVARDRGRPVGYIALAFGDGRALTIEQLALAPGYERCRLGEELVDEARRFALAEGSSALRVEVGKSDWTARSFYRRCGFLPTGEELLELALAV
jgi:ribosomal protein S18 acetylase RimI-like enzyme